MGFRRCKATFSCEDGHLGALEWGSAATYRAALETHLPVAQRSGSRETPAHNRGWPSFVGVSLSPGDLEPLFRHAEGVSRSLRESEANSPVRNPFRSDYFKRRARNWRADRFRVNALATRPGRSRFAACAYALLRQGVACAKVSGRGPAGWRGRVPGRPSRACSRIVSPCIERPFRGRVSLLNAHGRVMSLRS